MAKATVKSRLHRTVIVLICLTLVVILMQGASYFSPGHQLSRSQQVEQLTQTLAQQVAFSLAPLMNNNSDGADIEQITAMLQHLTLMRLVALAVGIVLARTLLQGRRSRWQQSPYLLTASTRLQEENEEQPLQGTLNMPGHKEDEVHAASLPELPVTEQQTQQAAQAAYRSLKRSIEDRRK